MAAECKRLRGPNDTGPDCGCRGEACALLPPPCKRVLFFDARRFECVLPQGHAGLHRDVCQGDFRV